MPLTRSVIVCLAISLALSACGRRGSLELPPESKAAQPATTTATTTPQEPKRPFQKKTGPDRPFILDPLI
ncbi:MAG TPA: lipoprotein [Afifellaceae bacterium]|nr:lipoprotein [Afifellaceae bacterium]